MLNPYDVDMTDLDESSIVNGEKDWMSQEVLNMSVCLIYYCPNVL